MLAYQMIYTACGKDKSGAFSVWAKSDSVTKAECDEIMKLMSYKKSPNAPYEPTEEEIKVWCPPKFAYFTLSSGRKCVAKSSYIGKVYSDLDPRNGNYIIHAFIYDDLQGFNPYSIFELDVFKTKLTYKEWHDDPVPTSLPEVELPSQSIASEAAIKKYLGRKHEIAALLQAVINAKGTEETVTFNDAEENLSALYAIVGTLLPPSYFADTTFCTQYSPQLDYTLSSLGMPLVKVRNIFASMVGSAFNYQEELDAGHLVFNFEKGIYSDIALGRYVTDIMHTVETSTLFAALKKIEAVSSIMSTTHCSIDTAIAVYYLAQKNLNWFSGAAEYAEALDIALQFRYIDEKTIASYLYNDIVRTGKWGRGSEIVSLIKFAYGHADPGIKASIIDNYFADLHSYGVNTAAAPQSVLNQVKENAPFAWNDFALTVVKNPKWASYIDSKNSPAELYFVLDAVVSSVHNGGADKTAAYDLMDKIINKAIAHRSLDEMQLYLDCAERLGDEVTNNLVEVALGDLIKCPNNDDDTLDFVFSVICSLGNDQEKITLLTPLVTTNLRKNGFMNIYMHYAEKHESLFNKVEMHNKHNAEFVDFLMRKDAYVFKNTAKVTYRDLADYYTKFYKRGHDNGGILLEKINQYMSAQTGKSKIAEGVKLYELVSELEDKFENVLDIIESISHEIFSLPMEELLNHATSYSRLIDEMNARLHRAGKHISSKYELMNIILFMRGKHGSDYCSQVLMNNAVYSKLKPNQLAEFVDKYFVEALKFYVSQRKKHGVTPSMLTVAIFEHPIAVPDADDSIIKALNELSGRDYYDIMADIMAYAFNNNDKCAKDLKAFVISYVDSMKRGDYKKLFSKVSDIVSKEDAPAVQKYIDEYSKAHMSFFEKLFSKKK